MSKTNTYVPSDLEQLLLTKEYDELTPQELELAGEHAANAQEYKEMQIAISSIVAFADHGDVITPQESTKNSLMDQFSAAHSNKAASWFSLSNITFRYSLVGLTAIFLIAIYFWPKPNYDSSSETAALKPSKVIENTDNQDEKNSISITSNDTIGGFNTTSEPISEITNGTYSDEFNTSDESSIGSNLVVESDSAISISDEIMLNINQANDFNTNQPILSNNINSRYSVNSGDSISIRFNGNQDNQPNWANVAQTRDYNYQTTGENTFNTQIVPVQAPQSLDQNIDLLNLLHTATEK